MLWFSLVLSQAGILPLTFQTLQKSFISFFLNLIENVRQWKVWLKLIKSTMSATMKTMSSGCLFPGSLGWRKDRLVTSRGLNFFFCFRCHDICTHEPNYRSPSCVYCGEKLLSRKEWLVNWVFTIKALKAKVHLLRTFCRLQKKLLQYI